MTSRSITPGRTRERRTATTSDAALSDDLPTFARDDFIRSNTFYDTVHSAADHFRKSSRRCTDLPCLVMVLLFTVGLLCSYNWSLSRGQVETIMHGIDFRGRTCGLGELKDKPYLIWCTPEGESNTNWIDPVCVEACSFDYSEKIKCPQKKVREEHEHNEEDGSVRIEISSTQKLVPSKRPLTQQYLYYCVPMGTGDGIISAYLQHAGAGDYVTQIYFKFSELVERWPLLIYSVCIAILTAYVYLFLLKKLSRPLTYFSFLIILCTSACCGVICFRRSFAVVQAVYELLRTFQYFVMVEDAIKEPILNMVGYVVASSYSFIEIPVVHDFILAFDNAISGYDIGEKCQPLIENVKLELNNFMNKTQTGPLGTALMDAAVPITGRLLSLRHFSVDGMFRPWLGDFTEYILFVMGILFSFLSFSIASMLLYSRKSFRTAISCIECACAVVFDVPLLIALPLLQVFAILGVAYTFMIPMMQVISAIPMRGTTMHIAGIDINGVTRSPDPSFSHLGHAVIWIFALIWAYELVCGICHFIASYTAFQWFIAPSHNSRKFVPNFLLPKGLFVALIFHVGSLALIAFFISSLRFTRWVYTVIRHRSRKDREQGRIITELCNSAMDNWFKFIESILTYVSSHIMTEIVISGDSSFCRAASKVLMVITENPLNTAMLHGADWVFTIVGTLTVSFSTCFIMTLSINQSDFVINTAGFGFLESAEGADASLFALVSAVIGACVGYSFMTLLDRIAETILYCYLSEKMSEEGPWMHRMRPQSQRRKREVSEEVSQSLKDWTRRFFSLFL